MTVIREPAPAKINLTLAVAGRRGDGFHCLESLVAFADVGDVVTLDPAGGRGLTVAGPQARGLAGGANIIDQAMALLGARAPGLALGAVHLEKQLPVAAGVGGGSADAAALLRAVRRANDACSRDVDWGGLARELGSDVSVCLESQARWMTGVGHDLAPVAGGLPPLHVVLANPLAAVPADKTARVFRILGAGPVHGEYAPGAPPWFADGESLLAFMRAGGNALAGAAEAVVPETGAVRAALRALPGVAYVAVSGAGPTCFGVFADRAAAEAAARQLAASQAGWWVVAATLR